jgi:hypothetical protein
VVYARWSPGTLLPCCQRSSQWMIPWAMDCTRWLSVLDTQITRPHFIWFLSMGPFKACRLCNTSEWCRVPMRSCSKCLPGDPWWRLGVWANSPAVCTSCSGMCAKWRRTHEHLLYTLNDNAIQLSNKVIISICVHYFDNEAFVTKSSSVLTFFPGTRSQSFQTYLRFPCTCIYTAC